MAYLGGMYANGVGGLQQDDAKALNWIRKSAEAGSGEGMADLGFFYENGLGGLPRDVEQAVILYQKAAQLGISKARDALTRLGR